MKTYLISKIIDDSLDWSIVFDLILENYEQLNPQELEKCIQQLINKK